MIKSPMMKNLLRKVQTEEWRRNALKHDFGFGDVDDLLKPTPLPTKNCQAMTLDVQPANGTPKEKTAYDFDFDDRDDSRPSAKELHQYTKTNHPNAWTKTKREQMAQNESVTPLAEFHSMRFDQPGKRRKLVSNATTSSDSPAPVVELQKMSVSMFTGKRMRRA